MTVRAVWQDETTTDLPIGAGTVESWKSIFKAAPLRPRFGNYVAVACVVRKQNQK
jgi:hypothetical protein